MRHALTEGAHLGKNKPQFDSYEQILKCKTKLKSKMDCVMQSVHEQLMNNQLHYNCN